MKKKTLIIGGGGFIGMNIAKFLVKRGDSELTLADSVFNRNNSEYFDCDDLKKIIFIKDDFTQIAAFENLKKEYDFVYILASVVGVNNTLENPYDVIQVNTSIILNTLNWLQKIEVKKILFSSTSETYSGTTDTFDVPVPTNESVPLCIKDSSDPRFTYAITKILGESAFLTCAKKFNFETTIVRYHNVFGPDMGFKHVIPHLVERIFKRENPLKMYGHKQTRAFSFIDDAVTGSILAMENEDSDGEIFHIGSPEEITIETLIREVGRLMNYDGDYIKAQTFPGSVERRAPDISKANRILGYQPKISWKTGLERTVKWYENFFKINEEAREDGFRAHHN